MNNTFLLNDFFIVESVNHNDNKISTSIKLNQAHSIFKGHFEQMPVVPGVCQTQIIKELLQTELGRNLTMVKGDNIKFMGMIVPNQNPQIQLEINYNLTDTLIVADAKLFFENTTFTKFKGEFAII